MIHAIIILIIVVSVFAVIACFACCKIAGDDDKRNGNK